jgi:hypothetical protein
MERYIDTDISRHFVRITSTYVFNSKSPPLCSTLIFYLVCEVIGTAATPGLLCQPRVILKMIVEKQMECRLAGETEILGENLSQRHFCPSQNSTLPDPGLNPGRRGGKPATNHLSYGAAYPIIYASHTHKQNWHDILKNYRPLPRCPINT